MSYIGSGKYDEENNIVYFHASDLSDPLEFEEEMQQYPDDAEVRVKIFDKKDYKKTIEFKRKIDISQPMNGLLTLTKIKDIIDNVEEELPVCIGVGDNSVWSLSKTQREKLKYVDVSNVVELENLKEMSVNEFFDLIDNIVDQLNDKGKNEIQKLLLLEKFYNENFRYSSKELFNEKTSSKIIEKYSKKRNLSKVQKKFLEKQKKILDENSKIHYGTFLLENKKGVCTAFASLTQIILSHPSLNIKNYYISSNEDRHALNAVNIRGYNFVYDFTQQTDISIKLTNLFVSIFSNFEKNLTKINKYTHQKVETLSNKKTSKINLLYVNSKKLLELSDKLINKTHYIITTMDDQYRLVKRPPSLKAEEMEFRSFDDTFGKFKGLDDFITLDRGQLNREKDNIKDINIVVEGITNKSGR